ncbi:MAG: signal peptidase I [Pseudomonadota bacterium]
MAFSFDDAVKRAKALLDQPISSKEGATSVREEAVDLVRTVGIAVSIALVLRIVLFQPFNIPSGSMKPTLEVGDYLFVSKYTYGYSRASLIWPLTRSLPEGRTPGGAPARGDVVVFKNPMGLQRAYIQNAFPGISEEDVKKRLSNETNYNRDYIKRLIGLPGDKIEVRNGTLFINDEAVPREYLGEREADCGQVGAPNYREVPFYRETLPNGVSYVVRECAGDRGPRDNAGPYFIREGHYFMMGDNRDGSEDSRAEVGQVPYTNLVGKAQFIFFSADGKKGKLWEPWRWPFAIRYGRLFSAVR